MMVRPHSSSAGMQPHLSSCCCGTALWQHNDAGLQTCPCKLAWQCKMGWIHRILQWLHKCLNWCRHIRLISMQFWHLVLLYYNLWACHDVCTNICSGCMMELVLDGRCRQSCVASRSGAASRWSRWKQETFSWCLTTFCLHFSPATSITAVDLFAVNAAQDLSLHRIFSLSQW